MKKPNTPKKPFALSIRWQLMLFIGGITLFTLLLVWGIITYALVLFPLVDDTVVSVIAAVDAVFLGISFVSYILAYFGKNAKVQDLKSE